MDRIRKDVINKLISILLVAIGNTLVIIGQGLISYGDRRLTNKTKDEIYDSIDDVSQFY